MRKNIRSGWSITGFVTLSLCLVCAAFYWSPWMGGLAIILLSLAGLAFLRPRLAVVISLSGLAVLLLLLLLLPAFQASRGSRPTPCNNNLKNIALALLNYCDTYKVLPPPYVVDEDNQPMHSWRVLILPFLDERDLYEKYRFDEPWYGPHNCKLAASMPPEYRCPRSDEASVTTDYLAAVGPDTMWPTDKRIGLRDVDDGTSNTEIVVESAGCGIHWMEPRDLQFDRLSLAINPEGRMGISSPHSGGALVAFVDGSVQFLQDALPRETVRALLLRNDGQEFRLD